MLPETTTPEMPYILLRASQELFGKAPGELDDTQRGQALQQAQREHRLESRVLSAPEAAAVIVPEEELDRAVAELQGRYADEAAFLEDLCGNGLDMAALRQALYRQCKVDSVLEKIAVGAPLVTDVDISLFYHSHKEKFHVPEVREAFHILITINDAYPENTREAVWERIQELSRQLVKKPHRFDELARRYSECPTAIHGGRVGGVRRGQLYEAVETALYQLRSEEVSTTPVESPMGFHIVRCGAIQRAHTVSLSDATPGIRRHLNKRFKDSLQKQWLASLPDPDGP